MPQTNLLRNLWMLPFLFRGTGPQITQIKQKVTSNQRITYRFRFRFRFEFKFQISNYFKFQIANSNFKFKLQIADLTPILTANGCLT